MLKSSKESPKRKPPGRPWKPGESGNPAGRPPNADSITTLMRKYGDEIGPDGRQRKQRLVEVLWAKAEKGDCRVAEYVIDRLEGRPKESHEVTTPDSGLLIVVRHASDGNGK